jgi:hypothetical protein
MRQKTFLKYTLAATVVFGLVNLGKPLWKPCFNSLEKKVEPVPTVQELLPENLLNYKESARAAGMEIIQDILGDYIDRVSEVRTINLLIERYGKQRVSEEYSGAFERCLNFFLSDEDGVITDEEYKKLAGDLTQEGHNFAYRDDPYIDYLSEEVNKSYEEWSRATIRFFIPLIETAKTTPPIKSLDTEQEREEYARQLVIGTYTRNQFQIHMDEMKAGSDLLYESMRSTLGIIERGWSGDKEINKLKEEADNCYDQAAGLFYVNIESRD